MAADDCKKHGKYESRYDQWYLDVAFYLPASRSIHQCCFVQVLRNGLQCCIHDDHVIASVLPRHDVANGRQHTCIGEKARGREVENVGELREGSETWAVQIAP